MQYQFYNKKGSRNLLLIFGGWSTLPEFYSSIDVEGWDTLAVTSYSDFDFPLSLLEEYDNIGLFAWSMGVAVAPKIVPRNRLAFAIAVNGTPMPVSEKFGIVPAIFHATLENLSPASLLKFRKRMGMDVDPKEEIKEDIEVLKNELSFIARECQKDIDPDYFTRAYVSQNDRIFLPQNQINYWRTHSPETEVIEIEGTHLPDLRKIISSVIIPKKRIGEKFGKALSTYEENAGAQKRIVESLVSLIGDKKFDYILEIGHGSGFLTRLISEKTKPVKMDFIDLYEVEPFKVCVDETYLVGDAEEIVDSLAKKRPSSYDAIVSASAIQWFVNPQRFLDRCAALLKSGGTLLISTFSPDNLKELQRVNPYRILYRSVEELKAWLRESFEDIQIEEERLKISFSSGHDLLRHLLATGVGASGGSSLSLSQLKELLPDSITYSPVYIRAIRK